jgi:hypothetical protein
MVTPVKSERSAMDKTASDTEDESKEEQDKVDEFESVKDEGNSLTESMQCEDAKREEMSMDESESDKKYPARTEPGRYKTTMSSSTSDVETGGADDGNNEAEQDGEEEEDSMAIMAALAMTQLQGRVDFSRRESMASEARDDDCKHSSTDKHDTTNAADTKRKSIKQLEPQDRNGPLKKRRASVPAQEDEEVRAAISSESNMSIESRNPSPVAIAHTTPPNRPPMTIISYRSSPPSSHPIHPPPVPHYMHYPADPHSYYRQVACSPPPYRHPPPPHMPHPPPSHLPPPPPPYLYPRASSAPHMPMPSQMNLSVPLRARHSYDETVRSTGLPKSLSFRKICSRCGKTRGEHGDLGFGNKCVFQECGRCEAGVQVHKAAGQPMGVLCQLTVEQGALPGASAAYERKLRDLAARANLQRELQRVKEEHIERMVRAGAP